MAEARRWTLMACPTCHAAVVLVRHAPLGRAAWCNGACTHPRVDMEPVEVAETGEPAEPYAPTFFGLPISHSSQSAEKGQSSTSGGVS